MSRDIVLLFDQWLRSTQNEIGGIARQQKDLVKQPFFEILDNLVPRYKSLRENGQKEGLAYVAINFLRTGLLLQENTHRIILLDQSYILDSDTCGAYWDLRFLYQPVYDAVDQIAGDCHPSQVDMARLESHMLTGIDVCNAALAEMLPALAQEYVDTGSYGGLLRSLCVKFVYGEYYDHMRVICKAGV